VTAGRESDPAPEPRPQGRSLQLGHWFQAGDLLRIVWAWAVGTVALAITGAILPGLHSDSWRDYAWVALTAGVIGAVVRPVLVSVSAKIGWVAVFLVAVCGQALVLALAIDAVPGVHSTSFGNTILAAFVCAAVTTLLSWVVTAGTEEAFTASLLRRGRSLAESVSDPDTDGVVFVQLDGVSFTVLRWGVQAGRLPTISRWLSSGSHKLHEWRTQIPCTTPASQIGILHGDVKDVPAFRWYDREAGRVLVANRPADAAIIEGRASDGRGLLADDGMSVSNVFSGDAERSAMTMSRLSAGRGSHQTRRAIAWYLARPDGFFRSLTRTIVEVVKERFQARRQRKRDLRPRVHRGWTFAILRAVSNGVLRDLNTAIVSDEMLRGTKVVYVDYVDYDEIAHHAGVFRPESLASLEGMDAVLSILERVAEVSRRKYHIVLVSDHGQSQGTIFADAYGMELSELCAELTSQQVSGVQDSVESWGRAEALLDDVGPDSKSGRMVRPATSRVQRAAAEGADTEDEAALVVLGSGNLGLVFVPEPERLTREQIDERWPALIPGLVAHPGIGFVACLSQGRPLAIGEAGEIWLDDGTVTGVDPLAPYGDGAALRMGRTVLGPRAPDLYVNSSIDETTLEVGAFEPLVGSHGGLGGWQDQAMLVTPTELDQFVHPIETAADVHHIFVAMLEHLGHRQDLSVEMSGS
jgi:uncharacterized membrane protein YvlD (DUF360 family)